MGSEIAAFRESPARSIFLTGEINQALVDLLTPQILRLQHDSKDPITVYIDSPGGSTYHARLIQRLLTNVDQDGRRCSIITVVTGLAASAAADILAAGHYAIAYQHAIIHFHGVRTNRGGDITHESASTLAEFLKQSNEGFALDLAQKILSRFVFVYMQLEGDFARVRQVSPNASDVECLADCMAQKLGGFSELLQLAVTKHKQLHELLEHYDNQLAAHTEPFARPADREAFLLKCLIDWERTQNTELDWRFRSEGLNAIREDFVLLADYEDGQHMANVEQRSREWGGFLLTPEQRIERDRLPQDQQAAYVLQNTKDRFRPVWHFLVSVCRALQQGENRLSAYEAYWLGLIDEVPGSPMASVREMLENRNNVVDQPQLPQEKPRRRGRQTTKVKGRAAEKATTGKF
jgi:ATP-dependent protease ClpP protease subunit